MNEIKDLYDLNDFIESKNQEVYDLKNKIEQLEYRIDLQNHAWKIPFDFKETDIDKDLPFPRFEMRLMKQSPNQEDWYSVTYIYGLVYRHYSECDKSNNLIFIPFSKTDCRGGNGDFNYWTSDLPRRDGIHIKMESILFNIPAFLICRNMDFVNQIDLTDRDINFLEPNIKRLKKP